MKKKVTATKPVSKVEKPLIRVATVKGGDDGEMAESLARVITKDTEVLAVVPSGSAFKFILRDK